MCTSTSRRSSGSCRTAIRCSSSIGSCLLEERKRVVGLKNVTINEPFFVGHFPGHPIMPAVLIVEAMAQAGGVLLLHTVDDPDTKLVYFMGIDNAKFRRPVLPGDQLIFDLEMVRLKSSDLQDDRPVLRARTARRRGGSALDDRRALGKGGEEECPRSTQQPGSRFTRSFADDVKIGPWCIVGQGSSRGRMRPRFVRRDRRADRDRAPLPVPPRRGDRDRTAGPQVQGAALVRPRSERTTSSASTALSIARPARARRPSSAPITSSWPMRTSPTTAESEITRSSRIPSIWPDTSSCRIT